MAAAYPESYSLWASPPKDSKMFGQLRGEIEHLAAKHGAPTFNPHVTVLGDIMRPKQEVLDVARQLAQQVPKYRVNLQDVTRGAIFYQCVYLLVAKDPGTMAAAAKARQLYGMATGPYMPHLSLLYSDADEATRARVAEDEVARLYGEGSGYDTLLVETGYTVESLQVWYTPTDDRSLASWCMVGEFELTGQAGH